MKSEMEYRDRRFALVLVDIQRKFTEVSEGVKASMSGKLGVVNAAIDLFRSTGNPVVYVYFDGEGHSDLSSVRDPDSLVEGMSPMSEGDLEVHKTCMNSFNGTDLAEKLREVGADTVLIAGLVAQYCVLATYYGAFDHGFTPYMLEGGIASTDEGRVALVEDLCKTLSVDEIRENHHFIR